jgi:hypothetical protein
VDEKKDEAKEKKQVEVTGQVTRRLIPDMSSRLVTKLCVSGREREEAAKEKKQAEVTGQVTRRLVTRKVLPAMSSRLVTKLWFSRRKSERERANGNH